MAIVYMTEYRTLANNDSTLAPAFKKSITNEDWVIIPSGVKFISAIVSAPSGSAKIYLTNDVDSLISSGDTIKIVEWEDAITSATKGTEIAPVAAIRLEIVSGEATLNLICWG